MARAWPEDVVMPFGKHKGRSLRDLLLDDPQYLDWLQDAAICDPQLRQAVLEMNRKYDGEIGKVLHVLGYG